MVTWCSGYACGLIHRGCEFDSFLRHNKTPLVRIAMRNHLVRSTSLESTQSPVSGFCYARNRVFDGVLIVFMTFPSFHDIICIIMVFHRVVFSFRASLNPIALYFIVLYCIALHLIAWHCIVFCCSVSYCCSLHCIGPHTILHCIALYFLAFDYAMFR